MLRDRRGLGVAEYALMLFLVIVIAAVAYRFIGKSVKHAGNKTEEQFQGGGSGGAGGKTAGGSNSSGGAGTAGAGGTGGSGGAQGSGGSGGSAGGGGGGGGSGGGSATSSTSGGGGGGGGDEDEHSTPLWKIIGGVFVLLFGIGGYFAF